MIIWSRFGILYPVLWLIAGVLTSYLTDLIGMRGWGGHSLSTAVSIVGASIANFLVAVIEEDSESTSSLFFIPMPFWSIIGLGLAVAAGFGWILV